MYLFVSSHSGAMTMTSKLSPEAQAPLEADCKLRLEGSALLTCPAGVLSCILSFLTKRQASFASCACKELRSAFNLQRTRWDNALHDTIAEPSEVPCFQSLQKPWSCDYSAIFVPALLVASSPECSLAEVDLPSMLLARCKPHERLGLTMQNAFSCYTTAQQQKCRSRGNNASTPWPKKVKKSTWLTGIAYPYQQAFESAGHLGLMSRNPTGVSMLLERYQRPAAVDVFQAVSSGTARTPAHAWADAIYGCEYSINGVVMFDTYTLARHARPFISSTSHLMHPEGICFAANHMFVQTASGCVVCISTNAELLQRIQVPDPWVTWGLAASIAHTATPAPAHPGHPIPFDESNTGGCAVKPAVSCTLYSACDMPHTQRDYTIPPEQRTGRVACLSVGLTAVLPACSTGADNSTNVPAASEIAAATAQDGIGEAAFMTDKTAHGGMDLAAASSTSINPQEQQAAQIHADLSLQGWLHHGNSTANPEPGPGPRLVHDPSDSQTHGSLLQHPLTLLHRPSGLCVISPVVGSTTKYDTSSHGHNASAAAAGSASAGMSMQQLWVTSMADGLVCFTVPTYDSLHLLRPGSSVASAPGNKVVHAMPSLATSLAPQQHSAPPLPLGAQPDAQHAVSIGIGHCTGWVPLDQILDDATALVGCNRSALESLLPWDITHLPGQTQGRPMEHDRPMGQGWLLLSMHRSSGMPRHKRAASSTKGSKESVGKGSANDSRRELQLKDSVGSITSSGCSRGAADVPHAASQTHVLPASAGVGAAAAGATMLAVAEGTSHLPLGGRGLAVALSLDQGGHVAAAALLPKKSRHTNMACIA